MSTITITKHLFSIEDQDVAAILNERFVNIKVDREERPDLDRIYMSAVQALTGQGGWPMSVFLRPAGPVSVGCDEPGPRRWLWPRKHGLPDCRTVRVASPRH